jgi:hypothetical protein
MRARLLLGIALALLLTSHAAALAQPRSSAPVKAGASSPGPRPSWSAILASLSLGASLGQLVVSARRRRGAEAERTPSRSYGAAARNRSRRPWTQPASSVHVAFTSEKSQPTSYSRN